MIRRTERHRSKASGPALRTRFPADCRRAPGAALQATAKWRRPESTLGSPGQNGPQRQPCPDHGSSCT